MDLRPTRRYRGAHTLDGSMWYLLTGSTVGLDGGGAGGLGAAGSAGGNGFPTGPSGDGDGWGSDVGAGAGALGDRQGQAGQGHASLKGGAWAKGVDVEGAAAGVCRGGSCSAGGSCEQAGHRRGHADCAGGGPVGPGSGEDAAGAVAEASGIAVAEAREVCGAAGSAGLGTRGAAGEPDRTANRNRDGGAATSAGSEAGMGSMLLLMDSRCDMELRDQWSLLRCLELLTLEGAQGLMEAGRAHAARLHAAGRLACLEPLPQRRHEA